MYIILIYDIDEENNGAKRWRNVYKICKRYLTHIQNSVFEGDLTKSQLESLKNELKKNIDKEKDSLIIFVSRNEKWLEKEFLGKKNDEPSFFL